MSDEKPVYPKFSYDEHARTCAPNDFLGQVCRTVQGMPVADDQIQLIVGAIRAGLGMQPGDALLELACGNGALSYPLFDSCKEYLGIDISDYMISVAKRHFELLPHYRYAVRGALGYVSNEPQAWRFSHVLCYAGFQYFSDDEASQILHAIFDRFTNVRTMFIGNVPDKARAVAFYKSRQPSVEELSDYSTAIGVWRTRQEFAQLACDAGWTVAFTTMPAEFCASHYRYDVLLSR